MRGAHSTVTPPKSPAGFSIHYLINPNHNREYIFGGSMRTILMTLMLVLTLTACGGKEDVPVEDPNAQASTEETTTETEVVEEVEEADTQSDLGIEGIVKEELPDGPLGAIQLKDGTVIEIVGLKKLGKYYLYISGKLNGRSSTVVSLTRYRDLRRWGRFSFKDPNNFLIDTKAGQQLRFIDSRIYIGSDSHETFSFYTTDGFDKELIEVKKADVQTIVLQ